MPKHAPGTVVTFKNGAQARANEKGQLRIFSSGLVKGSQEAKDRMAALRELRGTKSITLEQAKRRFARAYSLGATHPRTGAPLYKSAKGAARAAARDVNYKSRRVVPAPGLPGSSRYRPRRNDIQGVDLGTKVYTASARQLAGLEKARKSRGAAGLLHRAGFNVQQVAGAQQRQQLGGFWW